MKDVLKGKIFGVDCPDCAKKIEKKINSLDNVYDVNINFTNGEFIIEHSNIESKVKKTLKSLGYEFTLENRQVDNKSKEKRNNITSNISTILSGLFILLALIGNIFNFLNDYTYIFFLFAIIVGGLKIFKKGMISLRYLTFDMNFLMSIAVIGAIILGEYSEGALVVFLFSLGNSIQNYTLSKTRSSIDSLVKLSPKKALMKTKEGIKEVEVENIKVGDVLVIKSGDVIPIDGSIIKGTSYLKESIITGESMGVEKTINDKVYAGTINEEGYLEIKADTKPESTTLSRIIELVEKAQNSKPESQAFVEKFAKIYTPIVIILAALITIIPTLVLGQDIGYWVRISLILLVISCPCALVIATPVSIVTSIGTSSRNGVLVKGGIFLEKLSNVGLIAFDKTGTLTKGKPEVEDFLLLNKDYDREEVLSNINLFEQMSSHPIAKSIVKYTNLELKENIIKKDIIDFKEISGNGLFGKIENQKYYLGKPKFINSIGVNFNGGLINKINEFEKNGKTTILLSGEEEVIAIITLRDKLRDESKDVIKNIKNYTDEIIMLTGDNKSTGKAIGDLAGIDNVHHSLMPEDKLNIINEIKNNNKDKNIIMVGDGVNDGPALAKADIGIAMGGGGTPVALETADVVFMKDDLNKLDYILKKSKKTFKIIKQNVIFAIAIKLIFIILTMFGLANLWMAVLADTGAALLVILNAMRLIKN